MKETIVYLNLNEEEKKRIAAIDGYNFHFFNKSETVPADLLQQAEVIVGQIKEDVCNTCANLKYVQLDCAGVDRYTNLKDDIILANAKDVYGEVIGELMVGYVLAMQKRIPEYLELQKQHRFESVGMVDSIMGSKTLVIGMGGIGSCFAKRMHALGGIVDGVTRSVKPAPEYIRNMYTMDQIDEILGNYDIVALALPETPQTIGFFNEERLLKMKKGCYLLNVGRGSAIITDDLVRVIQKDHYQGVYLDVMDPEPLPKNHILWRLDRVLITPHVAGRYSSPILMENILSLIEENLAAYRDGKPLHHTIDHKIGY